METSTSVLISNYILENIKRIVLDFKICYMGNGRKHVFIFVYIKTCKFTQIDFEVN